MKYLTRTHKITASAIVSCVFVVCAYVYFYKYTITVRQELAEIKKVLAEEEKIEASKQTTLSLLEETEREREELSKYFISSDDPTPFLELLESSARDAGVRLEVESLIPIDGGADGLKKVQLSLVLEGTWRSVYHFTSLVERFPFATTITQSAFRLDSREGNALWKGQMSLEYVQDIGTWKKK